ncbi:hypothetical protein DEO72_LG7g2328 [Vigna unguiculata]|uniref:Uncharacterized protein n=1 Tax=Vigna unguiculata TaxID=3917 RepID=A0A4D6MM12_VIGUN|nr:hypothetical protein DEO72_LG7g2328 [Vigna unguiculata]
MYSEGLNHRGNPYQAPTPTQEGASPSGFRSTPTKHRVWTHGVFTRPFPGIPTIIDSLHPYTHYNFTLGFPLKSHSTSSLHAYIHPITSFNSSMRQKEQPERILAQARLARSGEIRYLAQATPARLGETSHRNRSASPDAFAQARVTRLGENTRLHTCSHMQQTRFEHSTSSQQQKGIPPIVELKRIEMVGVTYMEKKDELKLRGEILNLTWVWILQ